MKISVLLVDDHAMVRSGLALFLGQIVEGEHRIDEAGTVAEALALIGQVGPPDLVLLDIQMPEVNGLDGLALIRRAAPLARIAILSGSVNGDQAQVQALALGADGFLLKSLSPPVLKNALETLLQGKRFFMRRDDCSVEIADVPLTDLQALTPRFQEVIRLVARGYPNKVIGRELGLTENTVRFYVSKILMQLSLRTRTELSHWAHQQGLV